MRGGVWLADLARLAGEVSDDALSRVAASAGFVEPMRSLDILVSTPVMEVGVAVERAAPVVDEGFAPVPFWRAETAWFSGPLQDDGTEAPVPDLPSLQEPDAGSLLAGPRAPEAVPWSVLWPRIRALLRVEARGRAPDVPRTVQLVAKGQVLTELPRVRRLRWPERVELWLDRSWRNVPLFEDQVRVVHRVRRAVGARRVRAVVLGAEDQAELDAAEGFRPREADDGAASVLVLGDLGAWGSEAVRETWRRTAGALRRRGVVPGALVPPGEAPAPGWRAALWERPRGLDPTERRLRVERLLVRLSVAGLVEPGLVRAIRLAWREELGDLSVELELLRHPDVEDFDATAVVLRPEARARWRARYAREVSDEDKRRMAELLHEWHGQLPGELGYAEALAQFGLGWSPHGSEERERLARALGFVGQLRDVLHTRQVASREAEAWRGYARRMTRALPEGGFERPGLGPVLAALRAYAEHDVPPPPVDEQPRPWRIAQVGHADPEADELPFVLRRTAEPADSALGTIVAGDRVDVGRPDEPRSVGVLVAEEAGELGHGPGWQLRSPYQRLTLRPWTRDAWAVEAGRDRFGLWADLEVEGERHRMRWIPPGRCLRGSPKTESGRSDDEGPRHSVVISRGFWLGETPVTQGLWEAVMGENPSEFRGDDRPVESVSWDESRAFCTALAERCPSLGPRLPTEAEWEYACRAGSRTATWAGDLDIDGDKAPHLDAIAWYGGNSGRETHPVRTREPNPWGLYDMLGNVWEWCEDAWGAYAGDPLVDPVRSSAGEFRVYRGGCWLAPTRYVRAASRRADPPGRWLDVLGFRLAGGPAPGGGAQSGAGDRPEARDAPEEVS